jgi:hypothetical protein
MQISTNVFCVLYPPSEKEIILSFEIIANEPSYELATITWKYVNQAFIELKGINVGPSLLPTSANTGALSHSRFQPQQYELRSIPAINLP